MIYIGIQGSRYSINSIIESCFGISLLVHTISVIFIHIGDILKMRIFVYRIIVINIYAYIRITANDNEKLEYINIVIININIRYQYYYLLLVTHI